MKAVKVNSLFSTLRPCNIGFISILSVFVIFLTTQEYVSAQITSDNYHMHRAAFGNSEIVFTNKKLVRVAFLGGSITYNPGWRDSISSYIARKYPDTQFEFIEAGIPSMGSTPGAFRLHRDILSKGRIDLLFVEAAVNDPTNGRSSKEQIRGMEGILRHARKSNPFIDIVVMYFVDPEKMKDYNNGATPQVIINHDRVAKHYQTSSINLAKEVTERIKAMEFTWEDDFKDLHPSPFGQVIYYNSIKAFLEKTWNNHSGGRSKKIKYPLPEKLDKYSYDRGKLIAIEKASIQRGWNVDSSWNPGPDQKTRPGYVDVPMLISNKPGSEIRLKFNGRAIGIAVAAGPDTGMIEYSIDGGEHCKIDLFTKWSKQLHLPWYYILEAELESKSHELVIGISANSNPESIGNACRIKHFFINE